MAIEKKKYKYLSEYSETHKFVNLKHQIIQEQLSMAEPLAIAITDYIIQKETGLEKSCNQADNTLN